MALLPDAQFLAPEAPGPKRLKPGPSSLGCLVLSAPLTLLAIAGSVQDSSPGHSALFSIQAVDSTRVTLFSLALLSAFCFSC